ncbi:MAG TPA: GNAT family N-acetyltransferase [Micrococcaceae bacterium]
MTPQIRTFDRQDWPRIRRIYEAGIASGNATFDPAPPSEEEFFASRVPELRLAAVDDGGTILGWTAATRISARPAYRGVVEHSLYVDPAAAGHGVGKMLLTALADTAVAHGYWCLRGTIFAENAASIALHHQAGFRRVGVLEGIALMTYGPSAGRWRDTILFQRRL